MYKVIINSKVKTSSTLTTTTASPSSASTTDIVNSNNNNTTVVICLPLNDHGRRLSDDVVVDVVVCSFR
jgi:hypothetical protein